MKTARGNILLYFDDVWVIEIETICQTDYTS